MIQYILTSGLLVVLFYALLQRSHVKIFASLTALAIVPGLFFVWYPDFTTLVARFLGVDRGADLILYLWILFSFAMIVMLHIRMKMTDIRITKLAREMAISRAREPQSESATPPVR